MLETLSLKLSKVCLLDLSRTVVGRLYLSIYISGFLYIRLVRLFVRGWIHMNMHRME